MNLVQYRTNNVFPGLRDVETIFDRFFRNEALVEGSSDRGFSPALNLATEKDEFLVTAELPGVKAEDIELKIDQGILTISGEKKEEEEKEGRIFHRVECVHGKFIRKIRLSTEVDSDKIEASFENGVLRIRVPKAESAKPRTIPVNPA